MAGVRSYLIVFFASAVALATIVLVPIDWIGRLTGSTLHPRTLAQMQTANRKAVYFDERIPTWGAYKVARAAEVRPEVVYIGSSRGNAFREPMFAPYKFYNAALTAWTIDQVRLMLERMARDSPPKVAIISLDYWMFADAWTLIEKTRSMRDDNRVVYKVHAVTKLIRTLADNPRLLQSKIYPVLAARLFPDKYPLPPARDGLKFLGIDGMINEVGFRADGSFLQPQNYRAVANDDNKNFMGQVLNAFPGGMRYDQKQFDKMESLASYARSQGIKLIAVQLPIAAAARKYLDEVESYHRLAGLWRESQTAERRDLLHRMGVPFFDLSRQSNDNTDFQDAAHLTEKGMIKVLLKLAAEPEFRAALPELDATKLAADLAGITDQEAVAVYPTN